MTYKEFIQNIIDTRGQWTAPKDGIWENHHIIPLCLGGKPHNYTHYTKHKNMIWLTPEEHYTAHKLLFLENETDISLARAFIMMIPNCMGTRNFNFTAEDYGAQRRAYYISNSGENNPMYGKSSWCSGLTKENDMRLLESGKKQSKTKKKKFALGELVIYNKGITGLYTATEETKKLLSLKLSGKTWTDEFKQHLSEAKTGEKIYNNGEIEIHTKGTPPDGFVRGSLPNSSWCIAKGTHWYNNGIISVMCKECPEGFVKGRLMTKQQCKAQSRSWSDERKAKGIHKTRKPVICIETNQKFKSTTDANNWLKQTTGKGGNISNSCNHGCRAGGYHWKWL